MTIRSAVGLLFFAFILTGIYSSTAQAQNQDYRKVSLSVYGGATLPNSGDGFSIFESRFNVTTETSARLGLGLQYAITPAWSLEGGYSYTKITGNTQEFETNVNTLTLKNIFNLNQILFTNRLFRSINPFLTAGLGYDIYKYQSPSESVENNSMNYNLGVGLSYKLSQTIDLFSHYEYQISSNRIDNRYASQNESSSGIGADILTNVTGGIRINFGKKGTTHPSWRPVPVDVSPSDYDYLVSQDRKAKQQTEELAELQGKLEQQQEEHEKEISNYTDRINSLSEKIDILENQLAEARDSIATLQQSQERNEVQRYEISPGHYVQIFASLGLQSAENVRNESISRLKNSFEDISSKVLIAKRDRFYEVLIGVFNNYSEAEEILDITIEQHEDSFIITFPRPVSLQKLYKDMEVIK